MKEYVKVAIAVIFDMVERFWLIVLSSLRGIISIESLLFPYFCIFVGEYCYKTRGYFGYGGELLLPLVVFLLMQYIKNFANRIGKGISIPRPKQRFTKVHKDGEVTVENKNVEEMILYLSDLEDWMEYNHLL